MELIIALKSKNRGGLQNLNLVSKLHPVLWSPVVLWAIMNNRKSWIQLCDSDDTSRAVGSLERLDFTARRTMNFALHT